MPMTREKPPLLSRFVGIRPDGRWGGFVVLEKDRVVLYVCGPRTHTPLSYLSFQAGRQERGALPFLNTGPIPMLYTPPNPPCSAVFTLPTTPCIPSSLLYNSPHDIPGLGLTPRLRNPGFPISRSQKRCGASGPPLTVSRMIPYTQSNMNIDSR